MFSVKLVRKVVDGCIQQPEGTTGRLFRYLELPFPPFSGLQITLPNHERSIFPSGSQSVELEKVSWIAREGEFYCQCQAKYLIDLLSEDEPESDLAGYLADQVASAWDSSFVDPK